MDVNMIISESAVKIRRCLIYRYQYLLFQAYSTGYPVFDRFSIAL